ncbi:riboflavin synthase subunit alpha [Fusobacterium vincentii]|nr:riboflavin synthase subunit alpha [Fusobacterium vincentii]
MSRANLDLFEADLSASLSNLQRILNFLSLRNLLSNELFSITTLSFYFQNLSL